MKTATAVLAAFALLAAAGCGSGSPDGDGGGAGGGGKGTASGGGDTAVKYSQCMREHGVEDFPDPVDGRLMLRAGPGSDLNPDSSAFKQAQQACQELAPSGASPDSSQGRAMQAGALRFAQCMRRHGVPGFPDPQFEGGGVRMTVPRGVDPRSPQFQQAQQACQGDMALPGGAP